MKRKGIILLSSIFACVALMTTGFAAFIISYTTTGEATGNIEVDTVDNNAFILEVVDGYESPESIVYGPIDSYTGENQWLVYEDEGKMERLTTTIKVTCTNPGGLASTPLQVTVTANDVYTEANTAGYVGALPTIGNGIYVSLDGIEGDDDSVKVGTYTITITFSWGQKFGGVNPIEYYNPKSAAEYSQEALTNLQALQALANTEFKVTIAPVPSN
ncbi:MAG: hypothetical protein IJZ77_03225 [Bacilli bacterium]|nr:hypothetical protein [Bacilli bacterium]